MDDENKTPSEILNKPELNTDNLSGANPPEEDQSSNAATNLNNAATNLNKGATLLQSGASSLGNFFKSAAQLAIDNPGTAAGLAAAAYGTTKLVDKKIDAGKYDPNKGSGQKSAEILQELGSGVVKVGKWGLGLSNEVSTWQKQFSKSAQAGGKDITALAQNAYLSTREVGRYMQETGEDFDSLEKFISQFGTSSRESILKYQQAMAQSGKTISDTTALVDGAKYALIAGEMAALDHQTAIGFLESAYANLGTNVLESSTILSTFGQRVKGTSASTVEMAKQVQSLGEAFKYNTTQFSPKEFTQKLSDQVEVSVRKYEQLRAQGVRTFNSIAQAQETLTKATQAAAEKAGDFEKALGVVAMAGGNMEDAFKFMFEAAPEEQMGMMLDAVKEQFGGELMTIEDAKKSGRTEDFMLQTMLLKDMYNVATPQQAAMLAPYLGDQAKAPAALKGMRGPEVDQAAITDTGAALQGMNQYLNTSRVELYNFGQAVNAATGQLRAVGKGVAREVVQEGQKFGVQFSKEVTTKIMPYAEKYLGENSAEEKAKAFEEIKKINPEAAIGIKAAQSSLNNKEILDQLGGGILTIPSPTQQGKQAPSVSPTQQTQQGQQAPLVSPTQQTPSVSPTQQTPSVSPTQQTPSVSPTQQTPGSQLIPPPTSSIPTPSLITTPSISPQASTITSLGKTTAMNTDIKTNKMGGSTFFTLGEVQSSKPLKGTTTSSNPFKSYGTDLVAKEQLSFKDAEKLYETKTTNTAPKLSSVASNTSSSSTTPDTQAVSMTKDIQQLTAALKEFKQPVKIETTLMLDGKAVASAVKTQTIALINSTGASQAQT
jgi:hypothetical protein